MTAAAEGAPHRALQVSARLMPAALLLYLAFRSGGHPAGVASYAAVLLALWLAVRALAGAVERPGAAASVAIAALLALAGWTVLSGTWSGAPIRAILDGDRTILYVLVVAAFATLPRPSLPWVVQSVTAALVTVAAFALVARLIFGIAPDLSPHRLTWPLSYWNAMGLLMGLGLLLCVHLASSWEVAARVRASGAAAVPVLACALYLTLSRAGFGIAAAGLVAYAVLARPRGLAAASLAMLPGTAIVLLTAVLSPALVGAVAEASAVRSQGRVLAVVLVLAAAGTAWLLPRLGGVDAWARRARPPLPSPRWSAALAIGGLVLVVGAVLASGAPVKVYDRFLATTRPTDIDPRDRLLQLSNGGRVELWRVALRASERERMRGTGAGMFALQWDRMRTDARQSSEAHSLYVETLDELGVIGAILLGVVLIALPAGALLARGQPRADRALVCVTMGMWLAHAALEWDWEMPAVTIVPLAVAAAAAPGGRSLRSAAATGVVVAAVCVAVLPALTALSAPRVEAAVRAYDDGDCAAARSRASEARTLLPARPQPYVVAGLCAARDGRLGEAVARGREAVDRDPDNWEYRYDLAVLLAIAGRDPAHELDEVRRLAAIPIDLGVLGLTGGEAEQRRIAALAAPVLIDRTRHAAVGAGR